MKKRVCVSRFMWCSKRKDEKGGTNLGKDEQQDFSGFDSVGAVSPDNFKPSCESQVCFFVSLGLDGALPRNLEIAQQAA